MSASSSSNTLFLQDTDMSTSSSLTSLSSISSLATLSHRPSQSSFSTMPLSSSSTFQQEQNQFSSSTTSTPSPQLRQLPPLPIQNEEQESMMRIVESSAGDPPPRADARTLTKESSTSQSPLPPSAHYSGHSTTPTPASAPTPTLGPTLSTRTMEDHHRRCHPVESLLIKTPPDDV